MARRIEAWRAPWWPVTAALTIADLTSAALMVSGRSVTTGYFLAVGTFAWIGLVQTARAVADRRRLRKLS